MDVQKNSYTFVYSTVIVLVVATGLALVASALQPAQRKNVEVEKKRNILYSLHVPSDPSNAEDLYTRFITDSYTLNTRGEKVENIDPFEINLREEMKHPPAERHLPAFKAVKGDSTFLIIPVYGKGLWGPIWGYVAFQREDSVEPGKPHYNSIYGVMFDHKGETPGLGAEINQPFFQRLFRGKMIFDDKGGFTSVKVVKGYAKPGSRNQVDGISGGTITSKGLEAMLDSCLTSYQSYFKLIN